MKKSLLLTLTAIILASMFALSANAGLDVTYEAPQGTPTIDGTVEALWDIAPWQECTVQAEENLANDGYAVKFKALWDEGAIYVLVECTDPDPSNSYPDDPNKWDQDSFEVYLDEAYCRDESAYSDDDRQSRFVALNNGVFGGGGTYLDACESAFTKTATGYICEAKLIMKTTTNKLGNKVGADVQGNNAGPDGFINWVRWNAINGDSPYQTPSHMGTFVLVAAPVVETAAPETEAPATEAAPAETPVVTPAAQTGDITAVAAVALLAAAAIVIATKKRG